MRRAILSQNIPHLQFTNVLQFLYSNSRSQTVVLHSLNEYIYPVFLCEFEAKLLLIHLFSSKIQEKPIRNKFPHEAAFAVLTIGLYSAIHCFSFSFRRRKSEPAQVILTKFNWIDFATSSNKFRLLLQSVPKLEETITNSGTFKNCHEKWTK